MQAEIRLPLPFMVEMVHARYDRRFPILGGIKKEMMHRCAFVDLTEAHLKLGGTFTARHMSSYYTYKRQIPRIMKILKKEIEDLDRLFKLAIAAVAHLWTTFVSTTDTNDFFFINNFW